MILLIGALLFVIWVGRSWTAQEEGHVSETEWGCLEVAAFFFAVVAVILFFL